VKGRDEAVIGVGVVISSVDVCLIILLAVVVVVVVRWGLDMGCCRGKGMNLGDELCPTHLPNLEALVLCLLLVQEHGHDLVGKLLPLWKWHVMPLDDAPHIIVLLHALMVLLGLLDFHSLVLHKQNGLVLVDLAVGGCA
jgi:hypothetical protein